MTSSIYLSELDAWISQDTDWQRRISTHWQTFQDAYRLMRRYGDDLDSARAACTAALLEHQTDGPGDWSVSWQIGFATCNAVTRWPCRVPVDKNDARCTGCVEKSVSPLTPVIFRDGQHGDPDVCDACFELLVDEHWREVYRRFDQAFWADPKRGARIFDAQFGAEHVAIPPGRFPELESVVEEIERS